MNKPSTTRRTFLKTSGTVAAASALYSAQPLFARQRDQTIKIGLIGCGGRGTGAANQALNADPNVVLTAMADVFEDRLNESYQHLLTAHPERVKVAPAARHVGFEGADKVINSDVDVVLLATPPYFRPEHIEKVIGAGKHLFTEKPMAVDAPGVRRVMAAVQQAREKELSVVSGFCWRYHLPKRATFGQVHHGAIGDVRTVYNTYNTGALWLRDVEPAWSPLMKNLRNWLYYNWLSGDHITEQAVHSLDMMSWAMGDKAPLSATGTGGRQSRTGEEYGNVYDHFAIVYDYEDGARGFHFSRQQKDCSTSYAVDIQGTEGSCHIDCPRNKHIIRGRKDWQYSGEDNNMYQQEHDELFAAIRAGRTINDGDWMMRSTMLAIMGRMVAYTGQTITYEQALQSEERLGPAEVTANTEFAEQPVARPGITVFQ
jgi:predicted dehydrogenase